MFFRLDMNLVTTVRLEPEDPGHLLALIEHFNHVCNALSKMAFETQSFGWLALQRASYHWLRSEYGLGGKFVLYQVYERPEGDVQEANDWLGCDLGIVNILADSDGKNDPGAEIDELRRKYAHRLRNLQRKGTRAAKRKLRTLKGKQARFQRDFNHQLSKRDVAKALDTQRGIALENLKGIRQRITVRKPQRARHANWSFAQLRQMIEYKAALAGVPVKWVDPRNTSRTCPECGHVSKANRPTRANFKCVSCGFAAKCSQSGPADTVAAQNIRASLSCVLQGARGDAPMVAGTFQRQVPVLDG
jgi:IS605 OrfB family transposase